MQGLDLTQNHIKLEKKIKKKKIIEKKIVVGAGFEPKNPQITDPTLNH